MANILSSVASVASCLLHCGFKVKRYLAGQQKSALSLEEDQEPQLRRI